MNTSDNNDEYMDTSDEGEEEEDRIDDIDDEEDVDNDDEDYEQEGEEEVDEDEYDIALTSEVNDGDDDSEDEDFYIAARDASHKRRIQNAIRTVIDDACKNSVSRAINMRVLRRVFFPSWKEEEEEEKMEGDDQNGDEQEDANARGDMEDSLESVNREHESIDEDSEHLSTHSRNNNVRRTTRRNRKKPDPPLLYVAADIDDFVAELFEIIIYSYHDYAFMTLCIDLLFLTASHYDENFQHYFFQSLVNCCGDCAANRYKTSASKNLREYLGKNLGEIMLVSIMFKRNILSSFMVEHIIGRRLMREFENLDIEGQRTDVKSVVLLLFCCGEYFDSINSKRSRNRNSDNVLSQLLFFPQDPSNSVNKYYVRLDKIANEHHTQEEDERMFKLREREERELIREKDNGKVVNRELRMLIRSVLKVREHGWGLNAYQMQMFIDERFFGVQPASKCFRWYHRILDKSDPYHTPPFSDCSIICIS